MRAPRSAARNGINMKPRAGFTLIELLVVIMIVSILMGVGVPSYKYMTNSNRLSAEVNGLLGDMQMARSEAIKQGLSVTVCASQNQTSCSQSSDWSSGWIVFTDPGDVGVRDGNEPILRAQKALHLGDKLFDTAGTLSSATFNRAGFLSFTGLTVDAVTLTLHDDQAIAAHTRCLWIASQGLMTTQTPATDAGCK
jgi:type IV fimbrial biogenesis protein FimT